MQFSRPLGAVRRFFVDDCKLGIPHFSRCPKEKNARPAQGENNPDSECGKLAPRYDDRIISMNELMNASIGKLVKVMN